MVAALGRRPASLSRLIGQLDALNSDVGGHADLELALRRLMAAGYAQVRRRGFSLTRAGRSLQRRGSRGIRGWRLVYAGVLRELDARGAAPAPADWRLDPSWYDAALADYRARAERSAEWLALSWRERLGGVLRRRG